MNNSLTVNVNTRQRKDSEHLACDKCDHVFRRKKIKLRRKKIGEYESDAVREVYFNCPSSNCNAKYHVTVENKNTKAKQAQMRRITRMIKNRRLKRQLDEVEGLQEEYKRLQQTLKNDIQMLRIIFGVGKM